MPLFFARPFRWHHLIWLGGLSLASLLSLLLPLPQPLDVLIGQVIVWLAASRHAFGAMEACSRGFMDRPSDDAWQTTDPERVNLPWKLVGIMLICSLVLGLVSEISQPIATLAFWVFCLALPAVVMQLSASNDVGESINPARWWHFMSRIGWPYLLLCFFLLLLLNGMPLAIGLLLPVLGGPLALPLVNFVGLYFLLIGFLLMGYVMYQYHERLGLWALAPGDDGSLDPKAQLDEEIGELVAGGKTADALAKAEQAARDYSTDWACHERVYKILALSGPSERLREAGFALFDRACGVGRHDRALRIFRELGGMDAEPKLDGPQSLALAQAADKEHDTRLAVRLVNGFDKRFPKHPALPDVMYFSARLVSERLRRHDQATAILNTLVQRFPQHAVLPAAQAYLMVLEKMQSV